jgi:putative phosphoesterase
VKIGLISDTHGKLRPRVFDVFRGVDLILHAGDVGPLDIIVALETIAPVHAVIGNTDAYELKPRVRDVVELDLAGKRVVVMHGHQVGAPTAERLRGAHPAADIIIYGHTHRQRVDRYDGCLIINPGAAGAARFDLKPAVAILTLTSGAEPVVDSIPLT